MRPEHFEHFTAHLSLNRVPLETIYELIFTLVNREVAQSIENVLLEILNKN